MVHNQIAGDRELYGKLARRIRIGRALLGYLARRVLLTVRAAPDDGK